MKKLKAIRNPLCCIIYLWQATIGDCEVLPYSKRKIWSAKLTMVFGGSDGSLPVQLHGTTRYQILFSSCSALPLCGKLVSSPGDSPCSRIDAKAEMFEIQTKRFVVLPRVAFFGEHVRLRGCRVK